MPIALRSAAFLILSAAVVVSQRSYDTSKARLALPFEPPAANMVKAFDLGLHTAIASFLWLDVRTELPFMRQGAQHFLTGLKLVNDLDPRWSTPYAFAVLVLPNIPTFEERVPVALEIGERGLANADPNWTIPFYIGTIYQLELKDQQNAAKYFDIAAATPGIPDIVRRFAVNYGIHPETLAETKQAWAVIYATSKDPSVRERAAMHIAHLEILEYLNAAVQVFRQGTGRYPLDLAEVARAGIIPSVPKSPFGFDFKIYEGGVVGIAP